MGVCDSKDARFEKRKKASKATGANLFPSVIGQPGLNHSTFFAAFLSALQQHLDVPKDKAFRLTCKMVKECPDHVKTAWDEFLPLLDTIKPNEQRAAIIQHWLEFDRDASGDLTIRELDELIIALNFPDTLAKQLKAAVMGRKKTSLTFLEFEACFNDLLKWDELEPVWVHATAGAPQLAELSPQMLGMFLKEVQLEKTTEGELGALLAPGTPPDTLERLEAACEALAGS